MANVIVDTYLIFEFIRRLTKPFDEWEAYEQGVIDERGNVLKKKRDRKTKEEKDSLRLFDLTVLNLKKLLEKLPGGKSKIASYAAALFLIKENEKIENGYYLNEDEGYTLEFENDIKNYIEIITEDVVNTSSGGQVAGLDGDPPGPSPLGKKKKRKRKSTIMSRLEK